MRITANDRKLRYPAGITLLVLGIGLYIFDRMVPATAGCPQGLTGGGWTVTFPMLVGLVGIIWITFGPRIVEMVKNKFGGGSQIPRPPVPPTGGEGP